MGPESVVKDFFTTAELITQRVEAGKVSKQLADELAWREYDTFQEARRVAGDVDASLDRALGVGENEVKQIAKQ